jgi:hypothetical protein
MSQQQVQYTIGVPKSLQDNKTDYNEAYKLIINDLNKIENGVTVYAEKNKQPITCTVTKSDEYFLLSQLQLLKVKYIQYGIYYFVVPIPRR